MYISLGCRIEELRNGLQLVGVSYICMTRTHGGNANSSNYVPHRWIVEILPEQVNVTLEEILEWKFQTWITGVTVLSFS